MTDLVLHNLDTQLAQRIRRAAIARGWSEHEAIAQLLRFGLEMCENSEPGHFSDDESKVLDSAIAAMQQVPNDPGFALIGRAPVAVPAVPKTVTPAPTTIPRKTVR